MGEITDNRDTHEVVCPFLDGVLQVTPQIKRDDEEWRASICMDMCPYDECVLDEDKNDLTALPKPPVVEDITIQCKTCKTIESLVMVNGRLERTSHFMQKGDKIYHMVECGECLVFRYGKGG